MRIFIFLLLLCVALSAEDLNVKISNVEAFEINSVTLTEGIWLKEFDSKEKTLLWLNVTVEGNYEKKTKYKKLETKDVVLKDEYQGRRYEMLYSSIGKRLFHRRFYINLSGDLRHAKETRFSLLYVLPKASKDTKYTLLVGDDKKEFSVTDKKDMPQLEAPNEEIKVVSARKSKKLLYKKKVNGAIFPFVYRNPHGVISEIVFEYVGIRQDEISIRGVNGERCEVIKKDLEIDWRGSQPKRKIKVTLIVAMPASVEKVVIFTNLRKFGEVKMEVTK